VDSDQHRYRKRAPRSDSERAVGGLRVFVTPESQTQRVNSLQFPLSPAPRFPLRSRVA
jgi:hypothetical protein